MSAELLRVGIIGIGLYATAAHVPQLRSTGRAEIVAICRRNPERLAFSQKQLGVGAGYTDWREMLGRADLDAVVISTPHHLHAEQGLESLAQGLHVLMEKPLALTAADAWKLADTAEQADRILMVGYNRRFVGMWRTVKEVLDANGIGKLRQVNLQYALYRRTYWEGKIPPEVHALLQKVTGWPDEFLLEMEQGQDWHANAVESGGGMFSNSGSHLVDLILWLSGAPPVDVVAFSESTGMPAECFLNIQARLANGVLLSMTSGDVESGGFAGQGSLTFIGDHGIISYDFRNPQEIWLDRNGERTQIKPESADSNAAAAFVSTVLDGTANLSPVSDAAHATAFSQAVYQSAAESRIIRIGVRG